MFSLRNKKDYIRIILNTPSYLELCSEMRFLLMDSYIRERKCVNMMVKKKRERESLKFFAHEEI